MNSYNISDSITELDDLNFIAMLNELGYRNAVKIYERRKQCVDSIGFPSFRTNMRMVNDVMDLSTGYIQDFHSSVLVVADRLYELGVGVGYYIHKNTNGRVLGVIEQYGQAIPYFTQDIDFLIYCGYQKDESNYQIIKAMRQGPNPSNVVMYATFDAFLLDICHKYKIECQYDKHVPLSGLINCLNTL